MKVNRPAFTLEPGLSLRLQVRRMSRGLSKELGKGLSKELGKGLSKGPGLAADGAGNMFITNPFNHGIDKLNADGETTLVAGKPGESGNSD